MKSQMIWFGFVVSVLFYAYMWDSMHYIFGMSDVDNYLKMRNSVLSDFAQRHVLMQILVKAFPDVFFVLLLPAIYWFGLALPIALMMESENLFNFAFGTASMHLFFILGLWSQFLSIGFFLWGLWLIRRKKTIASVLCLGLSITYLPTIYVILSYLNFGLFLISTVAVYALFSYNFAFTDWHMWAPFLVYVCPLLWIKFFMGKQDDRHKATFFILALSRLSRGLIYEFPFLAVKTNKTEKTVIFAWWVFMTAFYLMNYKAELQCINIFECRNMLT